MEKHELVKKMKGSNKLIVQGDPKVDRGHYYNVKTSKKYSE